MESMCLQARFPWRFSYRVVSLRFLLIRKFVRVAVADATIAIIVFLVFFFAVEESFTVSALPVKMPLCIVVCGVGITDLRVSRCQVNAQTLLPFFKKLA